MIHDNYFGPPLPSVFGTGNSQATQSTRNFRELGLHLSPHRVIWRLSRDLVRRRAYGLPGTDGSFKLNLREFIKTEHSLLSLYFCHDLHSFSGEERILHFILVQSCVFYFSRIEGLPRWAQFTVIIVMPVTKRILRFLLESECIFSSNYDENIEGDMEVSYDEKGCKHDFLTRDYKPGCGNFAKPCPKKTNRQSRRSKWDSGKEFCEEMQSQLIWGPAVVVAIYFFVAGCLNSVSYTWFITYPLSLMMSFLVIENIMMSISYYINFEVAQKEFNEFFQSFVGPNMIIIDEGNTLCNYTQVHEYAKACHIQRHSHFDYYDRFRFADHWFIKGAPFAAPTTCMCACPSKNSLKPSSFDSIYEVVYAKVSKHIGNYIVDYFERRKDDADALSRRHDGNEYNEKSAADAEYSMRSSSAADESMEDGSYHSHDDSQHNEYVGSTDNTTLDEDEDDDISTIYNENQGEKGEGFYMNNPMLDGSTVPTGTEMITNEELVGENADGANREKKETQMKKKKKKKSKKKESNKIDNAEYASPVTDSLEYVV